MRPGLFLLHLMPYLKFSPASGQKGNGCGHSVLTPYSGTLTSKNYPGTYPNFTFCEWRIHGATGRQLSLIFGDMDIEASEQCKSGFLLVSSPSDGSSFGPYCSNSNPPPTVLEMNAITILFNSTVHRSGRGFLISYASGNHSDLISCLQKGIHYDEKIIRVYCPAGCKGIAGDIWGNVNQGYRDTSVLCKAAVHAGVILDEQGGEITMLREKGITLYESTFANGIYSKRGSLSEKRLVFHKACAGTLEIANFNASSYWQEENVMGEYKAWTPDRAAFGVDGTSWAANQNSADEWLEIDLGGRKNITGIITKGSSHQYNYYIKSYQVLSSRDGKNWKVYKAYGSDENKIFDGNNDSHQEVFNAFIPPIVARYLRIIPQSWNQKVAVKVTLLGCQAARPKTLHPDSDSGIHSGPKDLPILTSRPAIITQIPGIVVNSEKTGPPLLVMLLIGGFVLICSVLLLLVIFCHKKKAAVDQDCRLIKLPEASQVCPGGIQHLPTSEITSFHEAGMPVDVDRTQSPDYAEPDVLQVSPSSQIAPSTFKLAQDEGYTLPLVVNHYDVPSKCPDYAKPLTPEPEYATPFVEQATEPEEDACRKSVSVIQAIPSSKSLRDCVISSRCLEVQMQYGFSIPRPVEKLDSKVVEDYLQEGFIQTSSTYEDLPGGQTPRLRDQFQATEPATSSQGHSFKHRDSPLVHIYHEPL